ncbi:MULTISPECIES: leucyl/phenylalanyl-tRNA--protein transferase [Acinetobacter]|uniref:Leucyl/phenylalanyl-tRNA--protein transferase n=1 Tax=Acinetobacter wuhouensis TaxID=1879050 RepID=A0A3G2T5F1_9GAMM|nr:MULTISPECIES: leucyl/phenylalanyl-tRNA--protein transferase [Acinetobacter]AYO55301.1 leucyl/phenylalanyl-tRNA--protein transferase [Acinetobacter wuhouensis]RZG43668.1 leucyl/phenylalanyl-tRNA--protein transferase [Acinetobacter wuhouensis]RZG72142.1 leucyl/phenylalanyl-tRNA--protein transferase [Acinetobacter sp. WCHAc060025]RZG73810.1 leucyl/phenylalanyl-tRNA--protein transferase [Acinetobacter wuhouensis]RZG79686.1 leucyl/phenylalanyl-tRNA--protein transferase [Acinetobacter sp. WCHAc06
MKQLPPSQFIFPNPIESDPEGQGFICIGADLTPSTLYEAYTHGLFPWFSEDEPICWWSPEPRCIIVPNDYHPSKSLIRNMKKFDYKITINQAFEQVIRSCSLPRSYADETWISEDIIQGYCQMFEAGYGYSVEVWDQEQIVGGLYGVTIGHGCFGESMFSTQTDVSKMAFYTLMLIGRENHLPWIDCQLENDHLISLGACTLSRQAYIKSLQDVIKQPAIDWKSYQERVFSSKTIANLSRLTE